MIERVVKREELVGELARVDRVVAIAERDLDHLAAALVGADDASEHAHSDVAPCGTLFVSRVPSCYREVPIRSKIHVVRRRDLALPNTLNLLVEGSIPSGLTKKP